jgi:hypothetical protein
MDCGCKSASTNLIIPINVNIVIKQDAFWWDDIDLGIAGEKW